MSNVNGQVSMFGLFGDLFDGYNPEDEKKEQKKEKAKKPAAKKEQKDKTVNVTLPVAVYGRSFIIENFGEGTMTLDELKVKLATERYAEIGTDAMVLQYQADKARVYVGMKRGLKPTDFGDEEEAYAVDAAWKICDGGKVYQVEQEEDESLMCLDNVWKRFTECFPEYATYLPYCDETACVIVPIPDESKLLKIQNTAPGQCCVFNAFGKSITVENGIDAGVMRGLDGMDGKPLEVQYSVYENGVHDYELCIYSTAGSASSSVRAGSGAKKETKEKYKLPLTCFMATWGATYELTSSDFDGKEEVTQDDIKKHFTPMYSIFADEKRKASYIYVKETNTLSIAFFSGTKGSACTLAEYEEEAEKALSYGPFELIRSEKELQKVSQLDNYLGIYVPEDVKEPSQRVDVLPLGVFRSILGDRMKAVRVAFDSKVPKMSKAMFENIVSFFRNNMPYEAIVQVWYDRKQQSFHMCTPSSELKSRSAISYEMPVLLNSILVITIHSHNSMPAFFSSTDNRDECYPGLFGVIGNLDREEPTMAFRCGNEGVFGTLQYTDLFEA